MSTPTVVECRKYCTLNGWGFDGSYGTETVWSDGFIFRKGTASTRHQGTFPVAYWVTDTGGRVRDPEKLRELAMRAVSRAHSKRGTK